MKLFLLALLLVVILGGILGTLLAQDPGYVLVNYGQYALETSLWVALFVLLLLYLAVRGVVWLFRSFVMTQSGFVRWRSTRLLRQARAQTVRGLLMLAEGRWQEAEKQLVDAAEKMETPLVNYLNAARAAQERGDLAMRDNYLRLAHETTPGAKFAVTLTQAEFSLQQGQYEQAIAALLVLRKRAPRHPAVLNLLAQCYANLPDAQALLELLPELGKARSLSQVDFSDLTLQAWQLHLPQAGDVRQTWKQLPAEVKADTTCMHLWIGGLIERGDADGAEQAIRLVQASHWDSQLALYYGQVAATEVDRQLIVAQNWLKDHPDDAALLLTLGRLSLRNQQFAQGREYFEASLRLQPGREVYAELGRLLLALGDRKRGSEYLLSSLSDLPQLPMPETEMISKVGVS